MKGMFSRASCTMKTHKAPGDVKIRLLHESTRNPFYSAMKFVQIRLREFLNHLPHMIKDTSQLVSCLRRTKISHHSQMHKVDLENYYMSGTPEWLSTYSTYSFDNKERNAYNMIVHSILESQFVIDPCDSNILHRVIAGSGMGWLFSGEVSDMAYYWHVERPFILLPATRRKYGIELYARFRDDSIIVLNSDVDLRDEFF